MKYSRWRACALFAGSVVIAACSQPAGISRLQFTPSVNVVPKSEAGPLRYHVLHNFGAGHDGSRPNALIGVGDMFYGTTTAGGTKSCGAPYGGCGTFFSMTADGSERVLHKFGEGKDGRNPDGGLIDVDGTFYGATSLGGAYGWGTIFSIAPSGKEKVVHNFSGPDGEYPNGDLIEVRGVLYGTTFGGGIAKAPNCSAEGCGTVFSITTNGRYNVLHRFESKADGWYPAAGLADVGGTLYGTTLQGGVYGGNTGWGTLFNITKSGKLKVLYSFGKGNDGWYPEAALVNVNGTLYGTTQGGGTGSCGRGYGGCGTVFSVTTGGKERVLHSFLGTDGSFPAASLIDIRGMFYGVTSGGGLHACGPYGSCGTVFSMTADGKEKVLHSFRKEAGYLPTARLTYEKGSFFGATQLGGRYGNGPPYNGGVVFSLSP